MLNVVVAAFDNNMSAKTDSIWQYDYGQILQITGIDLPEAYEVHFANLPYTGKTITQIGTADGVSIPDCLLRNGLGVYAFIFLHEGANDGETRYDIIIPVKSRPEPSDEEPTPVEQSAITEAIAALNTAVTEANDAAERAEEASSHSPYIGENGDWYIWDGESWTDSGIQAEGETGPQGPQGPKGDPGEVTQAELDAVKSDLLHKADVIISSASGSIAHFEDGAAEDAVSVVAYINPVQSGSGDPTPDNVRPITGFTGMNIVRTGRNLLSNNTVYKNGSTYYIGTENQNEFPFFLKAGTYTMSNKGTAAYCYWRLTGTTANNIIHINNTTSGTFTLTEDGWYRFWFYATVSDASFTDVQLERDTTVSPYETYTAQTYPITFPTEAGTVYGGYVDVTTGVMTVDTIKAVVGGGNLSQLVTTYDVDVNNQSWGLFFNSGGDIQQITTETIVSAYFISDKIKNIGASYGNRAPWTGGITMTNAGAFQYLGIRIAKDSIPSVSSAQELAAAGISYLNSNPIEFVFKIEPKTYQLQKHDLETIKGQNNIWCDTGDTSVTYNADTKLYIEQLTKPTEDDMTANSAIASGKFFMVGNRLFISTTTIASGDTINPGTNCTELSLADALNSL